MKQIDPRQIETFLASSSVREDIGPAATHELGEYATKERAKTKWVAGGNVILPTGEFVGKGELSQLPSDEQKLLRQLGVEGFNTFREENIKLEDGSWLSKKTDEFKVLDAILDGYSTYEEIKQVTGLTTSQVEAVIESLKGRGLVK